MAKQPVKPSKGIRTTIPPQMGKKLAHGGDRKTAVHHLGRAAMHIQAALEQKLAERDK